MHRRLEAMLDYARLALSDAFTGRITFIHTKLPLRHQQLPRAGYDAVISNSLLHHLPEPLVLWDTVQRCAHPGAFVAVMDLLRPASETEAQRLVEQYATNEPDNCARHN